MTRTLKLHFVRGYVHHVSQYAHDSIIDVPESAAWVVFAAVVASVLSYIFTYSNPVIIADAWYFLDVFIRKAVDGTLSLGDFFVQRGGLDHAQPLRKLILLVDMRHFHLDFRYEAAAGWLGAAISLLVLRRIVFWHDDRDRAHRGARVWIWAAMCVALVSLNSTGIWGWPLVAGSFTSYVFVFAVLLSLWRWLDRGHIGWLVVWALVLDVVADDTAILANIACLIALCMLAWKQPTLRRRIAIGGAVLLASLIVARIGYAVLFTPPRGISMPLGHRLHSLWAAFLSGGWWRWAIIPLASSVCFILPLRSFAGDAADGVQIVLGIGLVVAHAWFWWRVFHKRTRITASSFAAIALMLFFYALLAGVVYGRVSIFGNNYLNQPRYVLVYSFNVVALLLMCASVNWNTLPARHASRTVIAALAAMFILWQLPLAYRAWMTGPYIKVYQRKLAWQIGQMARNPDRKLKNCAPELFVCHYPTAKRVELIKLLQSHQMNVFSPAFQQATGLSPDQPPD